MNTSFDHKDTPKNQRHSQHESQSAKTHPSRTIVHAKLEMTDPGDHDEQEADAMADAVVSGGKISRKISSGGGGSSGIAVSQQMESQLSQLQGGGRPMPQGLLNMMENGFGQDFGHVRIHTDAEAADMSSSISAKAFTLGNDIYFNRGQFNPETTEGQRLVAHELTHVVQGTGKVGREKNDEKTKKKDGLLSTEELLLLNILTYLPNDDYNNIREEFERFKGKPLKNAINHFLNNNPPKNWNYDKKKDKQETIIPSDWDNVFKAIISDEKLNNVLIKGTQKDDLNGYSILFINIETKEAIVAFRGTSPKEWIDNFEGGANTDFVCAPNESKKTITNQQENALKQYQEYFKDSSLDGYTRTVTGHSKGGNKAKFVTIMDESVDRGISFDGQGFSDEFIIQYSSLIDKRQELITNYNTDWDFVNLLLNEIGKTHFLFSKNFSGNLSKEESFFEYHSPEVMLNFHNTEDNTGIVASLAEEGERIPVMIEIDKFLNNYLRSFDNIGDTDSYFKTESLQMLGLILQLMMDKSNEQEMLEILNDLVTEENKEYLAYLLAYFNKYCEENKEFLESLKQISDKLAKIPTLFNHPTLARITQPDDIDKIIDFLDKKIGFDNITKNNIIKDNDIIYNNGDDILSTPSPTQNKQINEAWAKSNPEAFCELFLHTAKIERSKLNSLSRRKCILNDQQLLDLAMRYTNSIGKPEGFFSDSDAQNFLDKELKLKKYDTDKKYLEKTFKLLGLY